MIKATTKESTTFLEYLRIRTAEPQQKYPFGYCVEREVYLTLQVYKGGIFGERSFRKGSTPTPSYLYQDNKKR